VTPYQLRIACAWLVRQAAYQEARAILLAHHRRYLRARAAAQARDDHGRWTRMEARTSWPAST
jgi:hypothetical protein